MDWFILNSDNGLIENIGPHADFDAAEDYCLLHSLSAAWIANPSQAQLWREALLPDLSQPS